jgi:hypothetical protein
MRWPLRRSNLPNGCVSNCQEDESSSVHFTRFDFVPSIVYGHKVDAGEALGPVGCGRAMNGKGVG